MLNTFDEIRNDVLVKLNQDTTVAFYTEAILDDWIKQAHNWAVAHKKWPFTEGKASTTFASLVTNEEGYLEGQYPEGWRADSIRYMSIGGKRVQKIIPDHFFRYKEERSGGDDRVFTDFGRLYYVNPDIDISGSVVLYGQFRPLDLDTTDLTAETFFSGNEEEGNEAIVEKVLSFAYAREKEADLTQFHDQKALSILDAIWERIGDEQFGYHPKDFGMWKRFDVPSGRRQTDFRRDQFF